MFEQAFKNIDGVLWKDAGCTSELDYTEQTSWLLFLKYLDALEHDKATEAALDGKKYSHILDKPYRWESWAAPRVGGAMDSRLGGAVPVRKDIDHNIALKVPHRAGPKSVRVMVVSAWLTWFMALSEAANAWWGANQMLPIAAKQAGAAGAAAWQEAVVKLCHLLAALGLILSVTLLIIGIGKHRAAAASEAAP